MSVATKNSFALLDDDNLNRPSSPPPASKAAPAPAATRSQQKPRGGPASRGGNYYSRGGGTNKSAPKEPTGAADDSAVPERQKGENRGRGRGRGGRGGDRGGRGGHRPFDRHSATGKADSEKKVHQGWGGDDGRTEMKTDQAARNDAAAEGAAVAGEWGAPSGDSGDWGAPSAAVDAAPAAENEKPERDGRHRREREPEEDDGTLTFDQYLAQQKGKDSSAVPKLEIRKANSGVDEWKDVRVLARDEEEETYFVGKTKAVPKARAKKEDKVFLEIDARFERPDRGRGRGRGGDRSRGRGVNRGRGGNGPQANRQSGSTLDVGDETAFPSLS